MENSEKGALILHGQGISPAHSDCRQSAFLVMDTWWLSLQIGINVERIHFQSFRKNLIYKASNPCVNKLGVYPRVIKIRSEITNFLIIDTLSTACMGRGYPLPINVASRTSRKQTAIPASTMAVTDTAVVAQAPQSIYGRQ